MSKHSNNIITFAEGNTLTDQSNRSNSVIKDVANRNLLVLISVDHIKTLPTHTQLENIIKAIHISQKRSSYFNFHRKRKLSRLSQPQLDKEDILSIALTARSIILNITPFTNLSIICNGSILPPSQTINH